MTGPSALEQLWPLFGLRVACERVELRVPRDEDLAALALLARGGVHPPEEMPFIVPWTDLPTGALERGVLRYHWRARGAWDPDEWRLGFVVVVDGEVVGSQELSSTRFRVTRTVATGSWLGRRFQGRGLGREMRTAALGFAFYGLGALEARSGSFTDNLASRRVSEALGYRHDGTQVHERRGARAVEDRFVLTADDWRARTRPAVDISGLEPCRALLGTA